MIGCSPDFRSFDADSRRCLFDLRSDHPSKPLSIKVSRLKIFFFFTSRHRLNRLSRPMQGLEYADPPFFNPTLGSSLRMRLNTLEKENTESPDRRSRETRESRNPYQLHHDITFQRDLKKKRRKE